MPDPGMHLAWQGPERSAEAHPNRSSYYKGREVGMPDTQDLWDWRRRQ